MKKLSTISLVEPVASWIQGRMKVYYVFFVRGSLLILQRQELTRLSPQDHRCLPSNSPHKHTHWECTSLPSFWKILRKQREQFLLNALHMACAISGQLQQIGEPTTTKITSYIWVAICSWWKQCGLMFIEDQSLRRIGSIVGKKTN